MSLLRILTQIGSKRKKVKIEYNDFFNYRLRKARIENVVQNLCFLQIYFVEKCSTKFVFSPKLDNALYLER
jgi:hypothetical protein